MPPIAAGCAPVPTAWRLPQSARARQAERGLPEWKLEQYVPQAINDGSEIEGRHTRAQRVIKELCQGWRNG